MFSLCKSIALVGTKLASSRIAVMLERAFTMLADVSFHIDIIVNLVLVCHYRVS